MWELSKQWTKIFHTDSKIVKFIEYFNFIKGIDDMFNFFSDVKTRLTALEAKVEAIFTHIHTELAAKTAAVAAEPAKVEAAVEAVPVEAVAAVAADVEAKV
jgi:hypothetical protein